VLIRLIHSPRKLWLECQGVSAYRLPSPIVSFGGVSLDTSNAKSTHINSK
jgi:hypothetical protein